MTVVDEIEKLIARLAPEPICDECIALTLELPMRQHVKFRTRELAGSNGFERAKDRCSICDATTLVIRMQQ